MTMMKRVNTFPFTYTSKLGGEEKTYDGKFTFHVASMADKTKISVRASQILGGMYCCRDDEGQPTGRGVSPEVEFDAHMQAHLELCCDQAPEWFTFKGEKAVLDDGLIYSLYKEVVKYESTFRGRARTETAGGDGSAEGGEADGEAQPAEAVGGSGPQKVVGREVQAALDA